jgi:hypothetical protein
MFLAARHGSVASGGAGGFDATGGTITEVGGYKIHTFTASGTFTVNSGSATVEYLVVAGGGSGGWVNGSGGGGGGGVETGSATAVPGSYTVTVGAGGPARSDNYGANGNASTFNGLSATGGEGANNDGFREGGDSGGTGQGGTGYSGGADVRTGGGGGGDTGNGGNGSSTNAGNGGAGTSNSYSGSAVGYGGGAGGAAYLPFVSGSYASGTDGGGNGGYIRSNGNLGPTAGTANRGGGGGGSANNAWAGAAGGSGIVIVRYPV